MFTSGTIVTSFVKFNVNMIDVIKMDPARRIHMFNPLFFFVCCDKILNIHLYFDRSRLVLLYFLIDFDSTDIETNIT